MAAAASMARNVFVYGSLLAPEVLNALLKRVPPSASGVVRDYHRYSIRGRIYPAVLPSKGSDVTGKVLFDLTDKELRILDDFEGIDYVKETVEPVLLDTKALNFAISAPLQASMYVWSNSEDKDLYGDWDYEIWREKHLASFLEKYFPFYS